MASLVGEVRIIGSRDVHKPSGIRVSWIGLSLLSHISVLKSQLFASHFGIRPVLRTAKSLRRFLGNAFNGERILVRPNPRHLWATDRPRFCYQTIVHIIELELELLRTQMTQKPMLRAEVYAHAMCASKNRK